VRREDGAVLRGCASWLEQEAEVKVVAWLKRKDGAEIVMPKESTKI
jgi:hypothetical protein